MHSPVVEFVFMVGNFSECTQFCGREGTWARNVTCAMLQDGVLVADGLDDSNCTSVGLERPPAVQACNERPCPQYTVGRFGPVSG